MFDLISVGQVQQPQQQQPGMLMTVGGGGQVPMQMAGQQRMMIRNIGQQQQQGGNLRQVLVRIFLHLFHFAFLFHNLRKDLQRTKKKGFIRY